MDFHPDQLAIDVLAVVVTFGIGFLCWTLGHLFRESHPQTDATGQLFRTARSRR
jgi:hypothetical protein